MVEQVEPPDLLVYLDCTVDTDERPIDASANVPPILDEIPAVPEGA
ncbi:MAG: hypothetical protein V3S41_00870 [Spirochaetia bacterium]